MYVQPPVLLEGRLVAPWRLALEARVPRQLLETPPAEARLALVVAGSVVAEERVPVEERRDAYVASLERFYTEVEWPQSVEVTTQEQVYMGVESLDLGTCTTYTAVYAFAPAGSRVCVASVCEDTDRDNDGIVEVVYLARPGERVAVECEPSCSVRVWRTLCLTRLAGEVRLTLLDEEGNPLYEAAFPVETYEAPDWRPRGVTIEVPVAPTPGIPTYPWCDKELGDVGLTEEQVTETSTALFTYLVVYEVTDPDAAPPWSAYANKIVTGGFGFRYSRTIAYSVGYFTGGASITYDIGEIGVAEFPCKVSKLPRRFLWIGRAFEADLTFMVTEPHVVPCGTCVDIESLRAAGVLSERYYAIDAVERRLLEPGEYSFALEPLRGVYVAAAPSGLELSVDGVAVEPTLVGARTRVGELLALNTGTHVVLIAVYYPVIDVVGGEGQPQPVWSVGGILYAVAPAGESNELRILVTEEDASPYAGGEVATLAVRRLGAPGGGAGWG